MSGDLRIPDSSRAILIGVPRYQDAKYRSYTAVGNSVDGMYQLLVESGLCGWRREQVEKITDPANAGQLMGRLRRLAADTTGVLLLYFVGHGQPSEHTGELCLAIADTDHANPDATGLEYTKIKRMLHDGTPAAIKIAILDCCYSGRAIGLGAADDGRQLADLSDCEGTYTVTAADERAHVPRDEAGNARTAFTGELLDLLARDGVPGGPAGLTLGAIFPHLRHRLAAKALPRPNQRSDDAAASFVFARNAAPPSTRNGHSTEAEPPTTTVASAGKPPQQAAVPSQSSGLRRRKVLALSALGTVVVAGGVTGAVFLFQPTPDLARAVLVGHTRAVTGVAFSPDGKTVASASEDGTARLWDTGSGKQTGTAFVGHTATVTSLAFSPDGHTLATASEDGTTRLWDVAKHQQIGQPLSGHNGHVGSLAFSPDGHTLATANRGTNVWLWDVASHRQIAQIGESDDIDYATSGTDGVAFSPDGRTLMMVVANSSGTPIKLWDVARHQYKGDPFGPYVYEMTVAISPDRRTVAFASKVDANGPDFMLWNVIDRLQAGEHFAGYDRGIDGLAFSPDGLTLATAGNDGTVRLWGVGSHQQIGQSLTGHDGGVRSVAFSPDGRTLATGGKDGSVRLWDLPSRR